MKIYFPSYYNSFKCIAEKCRHSCCVGWEIEIDEKTLKKYERAGREEILGYISNGCIELGKGGRCPFLTDCGLCKIICELGDGFTSVICREHPRFYHRIGERIEGGIGASCEEAARIILTSDGYDTFVAVDKDGTDAPDESEIDTLAERDDIYRLLSDKSLPYRERVAKIRERCAIPKMLHTPSEWQAIFSQLELLDESHEKIISVGKATAREKYFTYFERFLAYLLFRHASVASSRDNLRARIAFCLLLTEMLENSMAQKELSEAEIADLVRIISEEIEYSEDNTAMLIFEFESLL